jgi:hypothetical protein
MARQLEIEPDDGIGVIRDRTANDDSGRRSFRTLGRLLDP